MILNLQNSKYLNHVQTLKIKLIKQTIQGIGLIRNRIFTLLTKNFGGYAEQGAFLF